MSDYSFYVTPPVKEAAKRAGIDPQVLINQFSRARDAGDLTGVTQNKSGMFNISFPMLQQMYKHGGYEPDIMRRVGYEGKRPWAGYQKADAIVPKARQADWDAKYGGGRGGGGGGGGGGGVGSPWDANNWTPYTPVSGFVQGFQPWNPINFTLDPSLQGTTPTFNPGGWLEPVPEWNPNVPSWPNFPAPSPPPSARNGGGGGGVQIRGPGDLPSGWYEGGGRPAGQIEGPSPDRVDPYGPGPYGVRSRMDAANFWMLPGQRGDQLRGDWFGGQQPADPIGDLWNSINQFFYRDGSYNDVWGGGGGGGRTVAPDPWAFLY